MPTKRKATQGDHAWDFDDPNRSLPSLERAGEALEEARLEREKWSGRVKVLERYIGAVEAFKNYFTNSEQPEDESGDVEVEDEIEADVASSEGQPSIRSAVVLVLKKASKPLHVREIWKEAQQLGASTTMARPTEAVHYALADLSRSGAPVEKVSPGVWRYKKEAED
jgi:hypothetical protein